MQPIPGSTRLLPDEFVQNDIAGAIDLLLREEPTPAAYALSKRPAPVAAGFKIMAHQIRALDDEFGFWQHLRQADIKVIVVLRYNILWQYVSDLTTIATGQPTAWEGFDKVKRAKIDVPLDRLEAGLARIMAEKRYLLDQTRTLEHRRLVYEDFKNNYQVVEDLLPWLIGYKHKVTTKLQKQNPDNLRARVANFKALTGELHKLGLNHLIQEYNHGPSS